MCEAVKLYKWPESGKNGKSYLHWNQCSSIGYVVKGKVVTKLLDKELWNTSVAGGVFISEPDFIYEDVRLNALLGLELERYGWCGCGCCD